MEFAEFAARAEEIAEEPGDLATTDLVCDLLRDAAEDLPTVARFLQGRVYPAWDATTLDVGPALLLEAIARAAGPNVDADDVESKLAELGEIGAVAGSYDFGGQRGLGAFTGGDADSESLTVSAVDDRLREIATTTGEGSEKRRLDTLFGLFNSASSTEATFLARLVLGEMRIGVGEGTVRDAIAEAFLSTNTGVATDGSSNTDDTREEADEEPSPESTEERTAVSAVERALQVSNDYGMVARVARDADRDGLDAIGLEVGRPVQAMLAQAGSATDALDEWGEAVVETKFDGARVQVHYAPGTDHVDADSSDTDESPLGPRIYSRNMDDVTAALPEIAEYVADRVDIPIIVDGEVVAVDDDGDPLPFQEVLRRFRRKHDVDRMREEVRLRLHAFDCLHADGADLLDDPLRVRHERLTDALPDAAADLSVTTDAEAIAAAERAALEAGHEGVMLKNPDSAYTPGDRGRDWLKRKPDVETLDAVVVGAEWGEGRRAELFGTFLLGVRETSTDPGAPRSDAPDSGDADAAADAPLDGYATVGKVATGVTDEELADLTERLEPHVVREEGTTVAFDPALVVEVGYEEIQPSPTYSAGYALRFPRFVGVREDKDLGDADSLERVERLAGDSADETDAETAGRDDSAEDRLDPDRP